MLVGMIVFVGGLAELYAGLMLWKMGDTFASLAFSAFGSFWLALTVLLMGPTFGLGKAAAASSTGAFLILWGLFAGGMTIAALKAPKAVTFLLGALTLLFFILAAGALNNSSSINQIGGYWAVIDGFSGLYITLALVINETWGRTVLPFGRAKG